MLRHPVAMRLPTKVTIPGQSKAGSAIGRSRRRRSITALAPNRFKALYGVAKAAERAGERERAKSYYEKLLATAAAADTERAELQEAKAFR